MELNKLDKQVVEDALNAAAVELREELREELEHDIAASPIRSALQQVYAALYIIGRND